MGCPKILAVDDEPAILRIIKDILKGEYQVLAASDGQEAVAMAIDDAPDLILIDNIMPGMSGLDVVRLLRRANSTKHIPIIMITALKESVDRVEAYRAGVDDFISKPFQQDELLARIESKLERFKARSIGKPKILTLGNLKFDFDSHTVEVRNKKIHLTNIELGILQILISDIGSIVPRSKMIETIWSLPHPDERLLDIHVATLRRKVKSFDHKIETVYGKGYIIRRKDE